VRASRALIIEDDRDVAFIFEAALRDAGFEAEIVRTGDMALQRLAVSAPAVVVLDIHLPRVAGTDILRQIRADGRLADTRVIVTTADATLGDALREDADLVLIKPISYSQLRDLSRRLQQPSLGDEVV
jgi:DNA-binding response OmpR family regulator